MSIVGAEGSCSRRTPTILPCHAASVPGIKYGKDRAVTAGHPLILAGRGAESRATDHPTQLLGVAAAPPFSLGYACRASLALSGTRARFTAASSPEVVFDLKPPAQTFRRLRAGLVVRMTAFELVRITFRGRLDPGWSESEAVRLRAALPSPDAGN